MPEILLSEREQQALRSLMSTEAVPGSPLPDRKVLECLAMLIPCDELGVGLADSTGRMIDSVDLPSVRSGDQDGAVGSLQLGFRNGPDHVAQVGFGRFRQPFTDRDVAMLHLIAPLVERHLQEPLTTRLPASLTVQERRVLQLVATGRSNAEVADCLCVAPSTVRKHLEHAYPKLGVSNRLAAVVAFEGRRLPDSERSRLVETFA